MVKRDNKVADRFMIGGFIPFVACALLTPFTKDYSVLVPVVYVCGSVWAVLTCVGVWLLK